ncbi:hypothetical protein AB835_08530 [Candidatus Endobugula sertula]|uniref:Uncharacterized protein n=1 Tax=Candidatus Endobugula sertula TaxID=62101 RepID=A0A1D2QPM5_9GAMM|nr:hypothetical protein AB835_08530 [Candidatus Endobugula sertula]
MGVICVQPLIKEADIKHFSDKEQHESFGHGEYVINSDDIKLNNLFRDIAYSTEDDHRQRLNMIAFSS